MKISVLAGALALAVALSGPAMAKDATCYTSDDGEYLPGVDRQSRRSIGWRDI